MEQNNNSDGAAVKQFDDEQDPFLMSLHGWDPVHGTFASIHTPDATRMAAAVVPIEPARRKRTAKAAEGSGDTPTGKKEAGPAIELLYAQDMAGRLNIRVGAIDASGIGSDTRLWEYREDSTGAHWRVLPTCQADAYAWLRRVAPNRATSTTANACVSAAVLHLQSMARTMPVARRTPIIPIQGAYLTIEPGTGIIRAKLPDQADAMTYTVPARADWDRVDGEGIYHPQEVPAESKFGAYLARFFPHDGARGMLQEAVGSSLMVGCRERAWQLVGGGSNGKSTLLHLLRALHPKNEAIDLSQLGEDKFALAKLVDATCIISTESTPNIGAMAEQKIKAFVSRDPMQVRAGIGKDYITVVPQGTFFFTVNTPITWSDQTYGMSSKIGIIPFLERVERGSSEVVLDFHRQITDSPDELLIVLDWALEGAVRVERQNGFSKPADLTEYADEIRRSTTPLYQWLLETECAVCDDREVTKEDVYQHYAETLMAGGNRPLAASKFWPALDGLLGERQPGVKRLERQPKAGGRKQPRTTNLKLSVVASAGWHPCDGRPHAWTGGDVELGISDEAPF